MGLSFQQTKKYRALYGTQTNMSLPSSPVYDTMKDLPAHHRRSVYFDQINFHIVLTDQPSLPDNFQRHICPTVESTSHAIRTMVVRGAPAIGVTGAYGMVLGANESDTIGELVLAKKILDAARPTAVNLTWATTRMLQFAKKYLEKLKLVSASVVSPLKELIPILLDEAERIANEDIEINLRMAKIGATIVPTFTHRSTNISHRCNTGSLATVDWGTLFLFYFTIILFLDYRVNVCFSMY